VSEVGGSGGDGESSGGPGESRAKVFAFEAGESAFGLVEEEVEGDGTGGYGTGE
jgi:hypothetical protein